MSTTAVISGAQQYLRTCTLLVSNSQGNALDLSQLRIKFQIKRTNVQTPNIADIIVYNLSSQTALQIQQQFTRIVLQAGYQGNYGVIFAGNIKQTIIGRESATDNFVEFIAGDGDLAYNFAVVNKTLAAGASPNDQIGACVHAMSALGTTAGGNTSVPATTRLPRGKVLYGNAKTYLRGIAKDTGSQWSIQNEQVVFIPNTGYLPGTAVVINAGTGMVGTPQQTLIGVNVKCLLNPLIQIGTRIKLDNATIARLPINLAVPPTVSLTAALQTTQSQIPAPLTTNGIYFVQTLTHSGDTREVAWYSELNTIYIDPALPPQSAVGV